MQKESKYQIDVWQVDSKKKKENGGAFFGLQNYFDLLAFIYFRYIFHFSQVFPFAIFSLTQNSTCPSAFDSTLPLCLLRGEQCKNQAVSAFLLFPPRGQSYHQTGMLHWSSTHLCHLTTSSVPHGHTDWRRWWGVVRIYRVAFTTWWWTKYRKTGWVLFTV